MCSADLSSTGVPGSRSKKGVVTIRPNKPRRSSRQKNPTKFACSLLSCPSHGHDFGRTAELQHHLWTHYKDEAHSAIQSALSARGGKCPLCPELWPDFATLTQSGYTDTKIVQHMCRVHRLLNQLPRGDHFEIIKDRLEGLSSIPDDRKEKEKHSRKRLRVSGKDDRVKKRKKVTKTVAKVQENAKSPNSNNQLHHYGHQDQGPNVRSLPSNQNKDSNQSHVAKSSEERDDIDYLLSDSD